MIETIATAVQRGENQGAALSNSSIFQVKLAGMSRHSQKVIVTAI
jgi:hypothetical protein